VSGHAPWGPIAVLAGLVAGIAAGEAVGPGAAVGVLAVGLVGVAVAAFLRAPPVRLAVAVVAFALVGTAVMQRALHGLAVSPLRDAVEHGADAVVVSNHGGRALDAAAPTIDVLPEVVRAVGGKTTVIVDSGIRRGSDMVKALALGADAVLTGRATLYGTSVGGQAGAEKAISILKTEFEKTMAYVGCRRVSEVTSDIFAKPVTLGYAPRAEAAE